jgi:DNA-binding MarR family transcriptional regulator
VKRRGDPDRAFEQAKQAASLELLFRAARLLNERAVARVREHDARAVRLRTSHTSLFPHLDFEGMRLTELAARVGVTKQAIAPLVDDLEAMGVVERVPDPADGRAKLIRFSKRGRAALLHGVSVLREIAGEVGAAIGAHHMRALRAALIAILAHLESPLRGTP